MRAMTAFLSMSLLLGACGATDDGGEEDALGDTLGGKFDSLKNPTPHGRLFFGPSVQEKIASGARYHEWIFTTENNSVTIDLTKVGSRATDTVVYLYVDNEDGTWSLVDKADDEGGNKMAGMWVDVPKGRYRIIVKGKKSTTRGDFGLRLTCGRAAEGCPARQCLFGDTYRDAVGVKDGLVRTDWQKVLTAESTIDLDVVIRQIIRAVNSTYEVSTLAEAFDTVDEGSINHSQLYDTMSGKNYYAFEFGAGDNSYGAIFEAGKTTPAAEIHDGDIAECKAFVTTTY